MFFGDFEGVLDKLDKLEKLEKLDKLDKLEELEYLDKLEELDKLGSPLTTLSVPRAGSSLSLGAQHPPRR